MRLLLLVGLVVAGLLGLALLALMIVLIYRVMRSVPSRKQRQASIVAWIQASGGRYRLHDTSVHSEYTGTPFRPDQPGVRGGHAAVRAWLPVRGLPVEVMEYQYVAPRYDGWLSPRSPYDTYRVQVVVMHGAGEQLPPAAHEQLAAEPVLNTVTLRLERGALLGWRPGQLIPESVDWQVGIMTDYLQTWTGDQPQHP